MAGYYICEVCHCQVPEGKEAWIDVEVLIPMLVCKECEEASK